MKCCFHMSSVKIQIIIIYGHLNILCAKYKHLYKINACIHLYTYRIENNIICLKFPLKEILVLYVIFWIWKTLCTYNDQSLFAWTNCCTLVKWSWFLKTAFAALELSKCPWVPPNSLGKISLGTWVWRLSKLSWKCKLFLMRSFKKGLTRLKATRKNLGAFMTWIDRYHRGKLS